MRCWLILVFCLLPLVAHADDDEPLRILNPATLVAPEQLDSTSVYLVIDNPSLEPDEVIAASSPVSKTAGLYNTAFVDGAFKPYPVSAIMALPASTTTLGPRGAHIKLIGLKQPIKVGDKIPLMLTFRRAGALSATATVLTAIDFVKMYPIETAMMTIKKLQAEQAKNLSR